VAFIPSNVAFIPSSVPVSGDSFRKTLGKLSNLHQVQLRICGFLYGKTPLLDLDRV